MPRTMLMPRGPSGCTSSMRAGRISYKGGNGPFKYDPKEVRAWLAKRYGEVKHPAASGTAHGRRRRAKLSCGSREIPSVVRITPAAMEARAKKCRPGPRAVQTWLLLALAGIRTDSRGQGPAQRLHLQKSVNRRCVWVWIAFRWKGKPLAAAGKIYLMLNKPRGIVTTAADEKGRDTVYSLLPQGAEVDCSGRPTGSRPAKDSCCSPTIPNGPRGSPIPPHISTRHTTSRSARLRRRSTARRSGTWR